MMLPAPSSSSSSPSPPLPPPPLPSSSSPPPASSLPSPMRAAEAPSASFAASHEGDQGHFLEVRHKLEGANAHILDCQRLVSEGEVPDAYCTKLFADFQRFRTEMHIVLDQLATFQKFLKVHHVPAIAASNGYFCTLPDELILTIFCMLAPSDISIMKRTCKFFKRLTDDDTLWREQYLKRWDQPPREYGSQKSKRTRRSWKDMFVNHLKVDENWLSGKRRLAQTYHGHTGTVYCLQFDEQKVISGSTDSHIKIWDLQTSVCRTTLEGHEARIRCLKYDDQRIISGSVDTTIKIWDMASLECRYTLRGHSKYVYCVQFDDTKIVSGSGDRTVKIWDMGTGVCINTIQTGGVGVQFIGDSIVTGSQDRTIKMWDLRTNTCTKTIEKVHDNDIWCLEVRGDKIASGSKDTTIKLWDIGTGKVMNIFRGHVSSILTLQMDDTKIISGARDESIRVWDINKGKQLYSFQDGLGIVWCVAFNDTRLLAGSNQRIIKMWDYSDVDSLLPASGSAPSSPAAIHSSSDGVGETPSVSTHIEV